MSHSGSEPQQQVKITDIERVAKRIFSPRQWLERFGTPNYGITTHQSILEKCAAEINSGSRHDNTSSNRLPDRWTAIKFGRRNYIFYASDLPLKRKSGELTANELAIIENAVFHGLERGDQKLLAKTFDCSESLISRTIANIRLRSRRRRENIVKFQKNPYLNLALESNLVKRVFELFFTVKEWSEVIGPSVGHFHGIHDLAYIYQMCAERPNGPTGNRIYKAQLPDGWKSVRMGESWLLYHLTLAPRSYWMQSFKHKRHP